MFQQFPTLQEAIIGFGQYLRKEGMNVGIQETLDMLTAAQEGVIEERERFFHASRALTCCSKEESLAYKKLFDKFWSEDKRINMGKVTKKGVLQRTNVPASIVMLGMGKSEEDGKESQETSGANGVERLRKTDFSALNQIDSEYLEELAERLWRQMSLRLKRRMKRSEKQGLIDLRKTIRRSISKGGDPIDPVFKTKRKRKQRLVIMLDVSGSMDKYSFFLLRFVCALQAHFEHIEAFLFSTKLVRITDSLQAKQLATTLSLLSLQANNWSSGTTIGTCFQEFNEHFAKQCMAGQTTVIILSDGLDTGEPEQLGLELQKIKLRCAKLIWLNPLKGMQNYRPETRAMQAALPHVDVFQSAHNLDSLLELEEFLQYV